MMKVSFCHDVVKGWFLMDFQGYRFISIYDIENHWDDQAGPTWGNMDNDNSQYPEQSRGYGFDCSGLTRFLLVNGWGIDPGSGTAVDMVDQLKNHGWQQLTAASTG